MTRLSAKPIFIAAAGTLLPFVAAACGGSNESGLPPKPTTNDTETIVACGPAADVTIDAVGLRQRVEMVNGQPTRRDVLGAPLAGGYLASASDAFDSEKDIFVGDEYTGASKVEGEVVHHVGVDNVSGINGYFNFLPGSIEKEDPTIFETPQFSLSFTSDVHGEVLIGEIAPDLTKAPFAISVTQETGGAEIKVVQKNGQPGNITYKAVANGPISTGKTKDGIFTVPLLTNPATNGPGFVVARIENDGIACVGAAGGPASMPIARTIRPR